MSRARSGHPPAAEVVPLAVIAMCWFDLSKTIGGHARELGISAASIAQRAAASSAGCPLLASTRLATTLPFSSRITRMRTSPWTP